MVRLFLRIALAGLSLWAGAGRAAYADALDDSVRALMAKRSIPGLSLAVFQDGRIVRAEGYGLSGRADGSPVTADTLFQAGSVSKPVTAAGALWLVDHQLVALDQNVNELLHGWQVPENRLTAQAPVTLRRLLSHSAGMTVHGFVGYARDQPLPTLEEVLDGLPPANSPPVRVDFVPGTRWRYSGGGYVVVQKLVMDLTGERFPDFMTEKVLAPWGMTDSSYAQPPPEARISRNAVGHYPGGRAVPGGWHVYPEMSPAGLWTTPSDLARFAMAVQRLAAGGTGPVLSPATARLMVTQAKGSYGLGFELSGDDRYPQFGHGGRNEGFDSLLLAYRDRSLGAVLMFNINDDSSFPARVMDAVAAFYQWPGHVTYRSPEPIPDAAPALTEEIKRIFLEAQSGRFDRSLMAPNVARSLTSEAVAQIARTARELGTLQSIALVGRRDDDGNVRYHYYLRCGRDTGIVACTVRPDGKLSALSLHPE